MNRPGLTKQIKSGYQKCDIDKNPTIIMKPGQAIDQEKKCGNTESVMLKKFPYLRPVKKGCVI